MAVKSIRPLGVPFVILNFRRVLVGDAHFCQAQTEASSLADFFLTVKVLLLK